MDKKLPEINKKLKTSTFSCDVWGKTFAKKYNLTRHIDKTHK